MMQDAAPIQAIWEHGASSGVTAANAQALGRLWAAGRLETDICWTIALAAAGATRVPRIVSLVGDAVNARCEPGVRADAASALAWMSFTNTYYRYTEGVFGDGYEKIAPVFRRKNKVREGRDLVRFELACLGISAINGCKLCTGVHRDYVLKAGGNEDMCRDAVEIAAHVNAIALGELFDSAC